MNLCVFCGSNFGRHPDYKEAAIALGRVIAKKNIGLVFGGAKQGLMGAVADSALENGGRVIGVLPKGFNYDESAHKNLTEIYIVGSMHKRKSLMAEMSDGFISMPGGLGTLEESFEMLTWTQLQFHRKPLGLLNIRGFFDKLGEYLDHVVEEEFVKPAHRDMMLMDTDAERIVEKVTSFVVPRISKSISR